MSERFDRNTVELLCNNWRKLKVSLRDCDEIRKEVFLETFQGTEDCLEQCLNASTVDKEYIPLIADAYAFAFAEIGKKTAQKQAAQILTERMLYQYAINPESNEQNANRITIYILETKRQINIDITDVATALAIVEDALNY
ncbi:MAG: hypothetical protein IKU07_09390 [Oscillospiraceae bacterium]|nr:hypothetical protein [Oscillospiraceae bacterium]